MTSVSDGSLAGNWISVASITELNVESLDVDGLVDGGVVDLARQVERVVPRGGRDERSLVVARHAKAGIRVVLVQQIESAPIADPRR